MTDEPNEGDRSREADDLGDDGGAVTVPVGARGDRRSLVATMPRPGAVLPAADDPAGPDAP